MSTSIEDEINKEIAENSTLFWAFRRRNRPTEDLSVGWGHNSQWRTVFRRDYHIGGIFYFNVDAEGDRDGNHELTEFERRELLVHRCFITVNRTDIDIFPYDYKLQLSR